MGWVESERWKSGRSCSVKVRPVFKDTASTLGDDVTRITGCIWCATNSEKVRSMGILVRC